MSHRPITVLKFGSSVLADEESFGGAVGEIYDHVREGDAVVAVVSAIGDTTDRLLERANRLSSSPDPASVAALLSTGEAQSAALLALALDRAGLPARTLDAGQLALRTQGPLLDAEPIEWDREVIDQALNGISVVVVPGFVGVDASGATSLLGRGGTDTTALFLAHRLDAHRCRLLKDVDGLYERDPNAQEAQRPRRYQRISWEDASRLDAAVVQQKAIRFAWSHGSSFEVAAVGSCGGTLVGGRRSALVGSSSSRRAVRVALLGFGTVGQGVYQELKKRYRDVVVEGILVRDREKRRDVDVDPDLLFDSASSLLERPCDVVLELAGGGEPARTWIAKALEAGKKVITANKQVIAEHGTELEAVARSRGGCLLYSASVGGGVPMIEAVARASESSSVESLDGVVNGTTNFVLDEVARGASWEDALDEARRLGFAEADASADLEGRDAAAKLAILCRHAFGVPFDIGHVAVRGLESLSAEEVREAHRRGWAVRLLASARRDDSGVHAEVRPVFLPQEHAFAEVRGERNVLRIRCEDRPGEDFFGRGAGRWPTTEAVLADLRSLLRDPSSGVIDLAVSA